jgi:RNA polymerase sigma-70 factor (ECF subfamily)
MAVLSSIAKVFERSSEDRRELFEALMRDTHRQAFSLAVRLTGGVCEAEDLVQETYVRAYRFFHRFDRSMPFSGWLFRIMTNLHIDAVRRKGRIRTTSLDHGGGDGKSPWDVADDAASPEKPLLHTEVDAPMQEALSRMTPSFRAAVLAADVEGMAYEEIADSMGISLGTVRSRIHRGRKQIREYLVAKYPDRYQEAGQ